MNAIDHHEALFCWQNDALAAKLLSSTTHSWTLQFPGDEVSDGAWRRVRISAHRKLEHRLKAKKNFHIVRHYRTHAALAHYSPSGASIFINSPLENPQNLLEACRAVITTSTLGLRLPGEYLNAAGDIVLRSGYGVLFGGPDVFVAKIELLLNAAGVTFTTLRSKGLGKGRSLQLLQLDSGFVTAESFKFEWSHGFV